MIQLLTAAALPVKVSYTEIATIIGQTLRKKFYISESNKRERK